ncbi:hypothetical protein LRAMOSA02180 [Lichtheimia ramosa]|uniref:Uncharacterized protein n=1 Tax=Lichtheimia ramosa TaxID=688394 RepID=A0A077WN84_9FUNG|nr:hypothetical protein LRAMOSA02180 [Lichtheimia ramosa]
MRFTNISLAIAVICFANTIYAAPTGNNDPTKTAQDTGVGAVQGGNTDAASTGATGGAGATGGQLPPLPLVGTLDPKQLADLGVDNKHLVDQITNTEATLDQLEALQDLAEDRKEDGLPVSGSGVPGASTAGKQPNTGKAAPATAPISTEQQEEGDNNTA